MAHVPRSNVVQMPQAQPTVPVSEMALAMAAAMMAQEGRLYEFPTEEKYNEELKRTQRQLKGAEPKLTAPPLEKPMTDGNRK